MKDINRKPTGETLRGDAGPAMTDKGGAKSTSYELGASLGGNGRGILDKGYKDMGGIGSSTKSDKLKTA